MLRQYVEKNIDEFSRRFDKIFGCDFDRQKFNVVSTCFIRRNFAGREIDTISMFFLQRTFDGRKFYFISMYFFDAISMDAKSTQLQRAYFDLFLLR